MSRLDRTSYFHKIARAVAERATCPRKHVGAVLVKGDRILATGYNGSLPGEEHCEDVGCLMENNHCTRVVHAEVNALIYAAKFGVSIDGATLYCTITPCDTCAKLLRAAGVRAQLFEEAYP